jgi:hypothetical protein
LIGNPSPRRNLRISAQSSTPNTPSVPLARWEPDSTEGVKIRPGGF